MSAQSEEFDFFVFLLIQYAAYKKVTADRVLEVWDKTGLSDLIYKMYWRYHTEVLENAFQDIDQLFKEHQIKMAY